MDIQRAISNAFQKGFEESHFSAIVSHNWEKVYIAYDSSHLDQGKRFSISLVMYPECTYRAINSNLHDYEFEILKESLTFKEIRNRLDVEKLEGILTLLEPLPLFSLTLTCDSKNWADIQRYLHQSVLEKEPLFRMSSKPKIAKLYLIQELITSILHLSNAEYRQIAILLDNDDFSSNAIDARYSKECITSYISKIFQIHPFFVSVQFKEDFKLDKSKMALLLLPDLLAGSLGSLVPTGLTTKTRKEEIVENWLLSQRLLKSAVHLTGLISFEKSKTTVNLHSWFK